MIDPHHHSGHAAHAGPLAPLLSSLTLFGAAANQGPTLAALGTALGGLGSLVYALVLLLRECRAWLDRPESRSVIAKLLRRKPEGPPRA